MLWLIFSQEVVLAKHHWKHLVQDYVAKFLPEMQICNFESATKAIGRPINLRNCFICCIKKKFFKQTNILLLWMLEFEIKSVILLLLKADTFKLKSQGMIDPRRENSFKIEKFPKSMWPLRVDDPGSTL